MRALNEDEKRVMSAVQFRARTPIRRVAQELGMDHRKVRRALKDLQEEGLIFPVSRVSYGGLGLVYHVVWGSLLVSARSDYSNLVSRISEHPNISWACSCWGDYDLQVGIVAQDHHTAYDILSSLGPVFAHTHHGIERYCVAFEKSFLSPDMLRREVVFSSSRDGELDELDFRITEGFQRQPLASILDISELFGVPDNTVRTRIAKLQQKGVLQGTHYYLQLEELGLQSCSILVQLTATSPREEEEMRAFCRGTRCITEMSRCSGSYDFELILEGDVSDFRKARLELSRLFSSRIRSLVTIPIEGVIKSAFSEVFSALKSEPQQKAG